MASTVAISMEMVPRRPSHVADDEASAQSDFPRVVPSRPTESDPTFAEHITDDLAADAGAGLRMTRVCDEKDDARDTHGIPLAEIGVVAASDRAPTRRIVIAVDEDDEEDVPFDDLGDALAESELA